MLSSFMKIMQSFIFMRNIKNRVEKVWWNLWCPVFQRKCLFLANIKHCPNFLGWLCGTFIKVDVWMFVAHLKERLASITHIGEWTDGSPLTWKTTLVAYFFTFNNYLLEKNFYSVSEITNKYWIAVQNSCSIRIIQIFNFFACKEVIST